MGLEDVQHFGKNHRITDKSTFFLCKLIKGAEIRAGFITTTLLKRMMGLNSQMKHGIHRLAKKQRKQQELAFRLLLLVAAAT